MSEAVEHKTPWQKVHDKFGLRSVELARALGCHRSKISRALRDNKGLITGRDQEKLIVVARRLNVNITADDLTPSSK